MANESNIWEFTDEDGEVCSVVRFADSVYVRVRDSSGFDTAAVLPTHIARELRDFLTAKLEGDDGGD